MPAENDPDGAILSDQMARALSRAGDTALDSLHALRDTVCEYVNVQRKRGVPLDEIIIRVSATLERARLGFHAGKEGPPPPPSPSDIALAEQIIAWCNEFYPSRRRKTQ